MKGIKKDNNVFYISLVVVFAIVGWGILAPTNFGNAASGLYNFLVEKFVGYILFPCLCLWPFAFF
jgi:glycine betaine transporter